MDMSTKLLPEVTISVGLMDRLAPWAEDFEALLKHIIISYLQ